MKVISSLQKPYSARKGGTQITRSLDTKAIATENARLNSGSMAPRWPQQAAWVASFTSAIQAPELSDRFAWKLRKKCPNVTKQNKAGPYTMLYPFYTLFILFPIVFTAVKPTFEHLVRIRGLMWFVCNDHPHALCTLPMPCLDTSDFLLWELRFELLKAESLHGVPVEH